MHCEQTGTGDASVGRITILDCQGEVHFQRHSSLIRTWAPTGQQPGILCALTHQKVGFFEAGNLKTGSPLTKKVSTEELQMTLTSHSTKWEQPNSVPKMPEASI